MAIPSKLLDIEEKWYDKVKDKADYWAKMVKDTADDYAKGLADATGVAEDEIKSGEMYKEFKKFASDPDKYKDDFVSGVKSARDRNKWAKNFYKALTGEKPK